MGYPPFLASCQLFKRLEKFFQLGRGDRSQPNLELEVKIESFPGEIPSSQLEKGSQKGEGEIPTGKGKGGIENLPQVVFFSFANGTPLTFDTSTRLGFPMPFQ
jgi:hypothetical protein